MVTVAPAVLLLRDNRVDQVIEAERLPLVFGSAPSAGLVLGGDGVRERHGEVRVRPDGRLEVQVEGEPRPRLLRAGEHLEVGPYALTAAPAAARGAAGDGVGPILELLAAIWEQEDPARLPGMVLATLAEALGAEWGAFLLPGDDPEQDPEVVADTGSRPGGDRTRVSRTVLARLARTRDPVLQADLADDPALGGARSIPGGVRSVIAARFAPEDGQPGLLYLESGQAGRPFGVAQRELLQHLSDLAARELHQARRSRALSGEVDRLQEAQQLATRREEDPEEFLGESAAAQEVGRRLRQAAAVDSPVLLLGETGTGKDLAARLVHRLSARARGPFVAVNGAALPANLAESLLFGHVKGAFSGAEQARHGYLRAAHGGTLLLDELADLEPAVQAKLLRVLQERRVEALGASESVPVDLRIVAATNADLGARVEAGRFREDLYYRVAVLVIELPPLRRRMSDLPLLVDHFLAHLNRRYGRRLQVGKPTMEVLMAHHWPGNVRELRGVLEQAFVRAEGRWLTPDCLRFLAGPDPRGTAYAGLSLAEARDQLEADMIRCTLADYRGDTRAAAERLGVGRSSLYRKCAKLGIEVSET